MSRVQKYKESLQRFIKDKSCLLEDTDTNNAQINTHIHSKIKENDLIFPILLLTIMNNQNKKKHMSMQGYYIASCIEFLNISLDSIVAKDEIIAKFDNSNYNKMCSNLFIFSNKSLQQNLESIKNTYQTQNLNFVNVILNSFSLYNNTLKMINSLNDFKITVTNKSCHTNIINWYLKTDTESINKFKTLKQVSRESIQEYIEKKYVSLCELSIILGWIIGGGDIKEINKLKKSAKYFAIMYKISKDFENLSADIKNSTTYSTNYVLNYGLQDGYEVFLNNKQKFIEESMVDDLYTNTIKEIIDTIEANVDMIIDQTSPDLKSTYSSSKNGL